MANALRRLLPTNGITRYTPRDQLPEYLRPEEAAAFLDVSKSLIYAMAKTGDLPSVRFGRLLRIPSAGLSK